MTQPSVDWTRIGRYLAGESPPDEAAAVRQWLDEHPADAEVIAALDRATAGVSSARPVDVEAALRRVKARGRAAPSPERRFARLTGRFEAWTAAAAILLVAGMLLVRGIRDRNAAPETLAITTPVGTRDSVTLRDGSRILLGPATRVVVRGNGRDVDLHGEAFFNVVKDARRPFTVHAGGAVIRDVGTQFTVHSDSAEPVRVVVTEGVVVLSSGGDSVTLSEKDVGVALADGGVRATRGAATADDIAWTSGRLVFRNAAMPELAADLRRWYGIEVRVSSGDSALLRRHFTGSFASEPPARVLDVIALALGARVEQRGDTAVFRAASSRR